MFPPSPISFPVVIILGLGLLHPHVYCKERQEDQELVLYQKLLQQRRAEHLAAVKSLMILEDVSKQNQMLQLLLGKLFEMMAQSKMKMSESGFIPGDSKFPVEQEMKSDISHILENILFFGDILLRLPDQCHRLYDNNKDWQFLVHWGITFTTQTNFLDAGSMELITLMKQELGLVEKSADYVNPYKAQHKQMLDQSEVDRTKKKKEDAERKRKEKREKKSKNKGPRVYRPRQEL